jgi:signal transduction histidine kinase
MTTTPRQIFRFAGLAVCAMITLSVIIDHWFVQIASISAHGRDTIPVALYFDEVLGVVLTIVFAFAFWWNTRERETNRISKIGIFFLVVQIALLFLGFSEGYFIIAAELPFMTSARTACKLVVAFSILMTVGIGVPVAMHAGDFVPLDLLIHCPLAISGPGTILFMLVLNWFAFGFGYLAVSESHNHRELARAHAELIATQSLLSEETRLSERLRISRELHDVVGHHLAGLSINLQLASHLVEGRAAEPVHEAHLVSKLLLAEVRDVVGELRDARQTDLRRTLELLSKGVTTPLIHLELPDDLRIEPATAHIFFRCVQEAITNAIKHANARNLKVKLEKSARSWEMQICDDGRGVACIVPGNGLKGMAERLEEAGGQLKIESKQGEGFTLHAILPCAGELA